MTSRDDTDIDDTGLDETEKTGNAGKTGIAAAGTDTGDLHTPGAGDSDETAGLPGPLDGEEGEDGEEPPPPRLTPRQARRVRALTSAGVMVAVGVAMVVRFRTEASLLTFALYGGALILSGTAIMLSRAGRTRVAMAVLAAGFAFVVADQLLR
ncbi:hypothetical protein AA958_32020 [Streptomyces sp. CNQ-509]|uniref:hypothetical protein n=1 Tax=unclassified Streptomyces TaxID=2593676 RepID=UPI00062E021D|nr:hypothetical protein [Streptomyces sp. CNQ-509]AKH86081.1 hypothetical protein AA958_32020 [Streptomyces sp. CNQ-509]